MARFTTRLLSATLAACMSLGAVTVHAQPHAAGKDRHDMRQNDRRQVDQRKDPHRPPNQRAPHFDSHQNRGHNSHGPRWVKGERMPAQYRTRHYVVNDWRNHRLSAPPRGYHWVQNGGDYLLVAIATGVITSIVLGSR